MAPRRVTRSRKNNPIPIDMVTEPHTHPPLAPPHRKRSRRTVISPEPESNLTISKLETLISDIDIAVNEVSGLESALEYPINFAVGAAVERESETAVVQQKITRVLMGMAYLFLIHPQRAVSR